MVRVALRLGPIDCLVPLSPPPLRGEGPCILSSLASFLAYLAPLREVPFKRQQGTSRKGAKYAKKDAKKNCHRNRNEQSEAAVSPSWPCPMGPPSPARRPAGRRAPGRPGTTPSRARTENSPA